MRPRDAIRPVVIAAGGTGGHFFPAEALASELIRRGQRVVLVTDARSSALHSTVFRDRERYVLKGKGIAGRGLKRGVVAAGSMALGMAQAFGILRKLQPSVLVGFGGYPTVAPVLAARLLRKRPAIVLHEQNAVLGRANRFLSSRADLIALGFDDTLRVSGRTPVSVVGNPVRDAIRAIDPTYIPPGDGEIRLLVIGGSLGARVFSDVLPDAIYGMPTALRMRLNITQQVRSEDLERVRQVYARAKINSYLSTFFTDIAEHLRDAHLVIARAGASTCAEIMAAGRPSLLVPLPGAIDDHQKRNAEATGGAMIMSQTEFTSVALRQRLEASLANVDGLMRAAELARQSARLNAAERLANLVEEPLALGVL